MELYGSNTLQPEFAIVLLYDVDVEPRAFVEDMTESWNEKRKGQ